MNLELCYVLARNMSVAKNLEKQNSSDGCYGEMFEFFLGSSMRLVTSVLSSINYMGCLYLESNINYSGLWTVSTYKSVVLTIMFIFF